MCTPSFYFKVAIFKYIILTLNCLLFDKIIDKINYNQFF